jgi:hypothetical protein
LNHTTTAFPVPESKTSDAGEQTDEQPPTFSPPFHRTKHTNYAEQLPPDQKEKTAPINPNHPLIASRLLATISLSHEQNENKQMNKNIKNIQQRVFASGHPPDY